MSEVPDDLLFKLPKKYKPGADLLSKFIARSQEVIDAVTTTVLDIPKGTYTSTHTRFPDGSECDVLYVPRSADNGSLPPILLEIQHTVTQEFMSRVILYSLNVFREYKKYPIVMIICVEKVGSGQLEKKFTPFNTLPFLLTTPCEHWARECLMVTRNSIAEFVDPTSNDDLHPLVALTYFLTAGQRNILSLNHWEDPAIINLFKKAKEIVHRNAEPEDNKVEALQTVCEATEQQFSKIIRDLRSNPDRAMAYAKAGYGYSSRLKRKYAEMAEREEEGSQTTSPMAEPPELALPADDSQNTKLENDILIKFVDDYISKLTGRMNWANCFEEGKQQGLFRRYINSASLKATYYRLKKA
ncbi:hypothetical protein DFQ28_003767 [Apophysomyces sp. BC1034]|nr:hypothetical protein DFQ29_003134 [Apophysomyces sp. BC1021]KAG0178546.1 hypothetical protein DFQ28_003767 [Apophysomyces sp. BC1034]